MVLYVLIGLLVVGGLFAISFYVSINATVDGRSDCECTCRLHAEGLEITFSGHSKRITLTSIAISRTLFESVSWTIPEGFVESEDKSPPSEYIEPDLEELADFRGDSLTDAEIDAETAIQIREYEEMTNEMNRVAKLFVGRRKIRFSDHRALIVLGTDRAPQVAGDISFTMEKRAGLFGLTSGCVCHYVPNESLRDSVSAES